MAPSVCRIVLPFVLLFALAGCEGSDGPAAGDVVVDFVRESGSNARCQLLTTDEQENYGTNCENLEPVTFDAVEVRREDCRDGPVAGFPEDAEEVCQVEVTFDGNQGEFDVVKLEGGYLIDDLP